MVVVVVEGVALGAGPEGWVVVVGGAGGGHWGRDVTVGWCNVHLADEIMLISIISLIVIFAHAPVLSNLIYTKHAQ